MYRYSYARKKYAQKSTLNSEVTKTGTPACKFKFPNVESKVKSKVKSKVESKVNFRVESTAKIFANRRGVDH